MTETDKQAKVYTPKGKKILILEYLLEETDTDEKRSSHKKMTEKLPEMKPATIFYHLKQLVENRILWKEDIPIICSNNQPQIVKRYHISDDKLEMIKKLVSDFRNKG